MRLKIAPDIALSVCRGVGAWQGRSGAGLVQGRLAAEQWLSDYDEPGSSYRPGDRHMVFVPTCIPGSGPFYDMGRANKLCDSLKFSSSGEGCNLLLLHTRHAIGWIKLFANVVENSPRRDR
jgi:hypothetical protein